MTHYIPRVVVAGLKGGSGKTTLSLGLLSVFKKKGRKIVPFKKGPDYIDPGWLSRAAGQPCYNLDSFLFSENEILRSFVENASRSEGALIEGNRGIFDGMDEKGTFSTARLAKSLVSPVILTVDCSKVTTTMAAMIKGVLEFDADLTVGGVVLNQVAGARHERVIRSAIESHTDTRVIGALRRRKDDLIGERHLGLIPQQESEEVDGILERIGIFIEDSVDMEQVAEIMEGTPPLELETGGEESRPPVNEDVRVKIGVFKDNAFQFYYPENIENLEKCGARIVEINALQDERIPEVDSLYIGGGFPETQAGELSKNVSLLRSVKEHAESGMPVYAECGGLMYLGENIEYKGRSYKMAGVLPVSFIMQSRPEAHGYTVVEVIKQNPYYKIGTELKGHEFHYSRVVGTKGYSRDDLAFRMKRGKGFGEGYDGIVHKNVFATYTHVHALGSHEWIEGMIRVARESMELRKK